MLYDRTNFLNKSIPYLISCEIIEYDIKSAGFNITKKYRLLTPEKISYLESLEKKERQIQIGLYQREDREYAKTLRACFRDVRRLFFEANNLQDDEVLSIKNDAIFTFRHCDVTEFDNIKFIEKHTYTAYYYINKKEFYVGNGFVDVKGINDNKLTLHEPYMLDFLYRIFKMMETSPQRVVARTIKEFADCYKRHQLHLGYYRELNSTYAFRLKQTIRGKSLGIFDIEDVIDINQLDINYNYMHYIVPLINLNV